MAERRKLSSDQKLHELQEIPEDLSDVSDGESIHDSSDDYQPLLRISSSSESISNEDEMGHDFISFHQHRGARGRPSARRQRGRAGSCGRGSGAGKLSRMAAGEKLVSPDGTEWEISTGNTSAGRRPQRNVLREEPGPTPYAKRHISEDSVASSWLLMIDDYILQRIKQCTEKEAHRRQGNQEWSLETSELLAFIGILYVRGATGAKGLDLTSLWSNEWGIPFCKKAMSKNRFKEILMYLRFDDKSTRSERLKTDRFALFSEIWNRFVSNIQTCYKAGPHVTIDEQLFPSKARCRFTQFMASKPDKYGQKFWMAVDNDTKYLLNAFPYLGKDDTRPADKRLGDYVVMKLMEPLLKKGRNVTCDNFFTSLSLADHLMKAQMTLVGTMNRARREVPSDVKNAREALYNTQVLKSGDATMTIYQGKVTKNVIILSTMHTDVQLGEDAKKKPETIKFYNETKSGVDVLDQMARKYSVKAASRRWPVHTFYNTLDLAAINSWVLYKTVCNVRISRRDFILKLGKELAQEHTEKRNKTTTAMDDVDTSNVPTADSTLRRCQIKRTCNQGRSSNHCTKCRKVVCKKCIGGKAVMCVDCVTK